jgi:hypothetical protein
LQLNAVEEKLQIVEKFATETSDKYTELLEAQNNRNKAKSGDVTVQLKSVSLRIGESKGWRFYFQLLFL